MKSLSPFFAEFLLPFRCSFLFMLLKSAVKVYCLFLSFVPGKGEGEDVLHVLSISYTHPLTQASRSLTPYATSSPAGTAQLGNGANVAPICGIVYTAPASPRLPF